MTDPVHPLAQCYQELLTEAGFTADLRAGARPGVGALLEVRAGDEQYLLCVHDQGERFVRIGAGFYLDGLPAERALRRANDVNARLALMKVSVDLEQQVAHFEVEHLLEGAPADLGRLLKAMSWIRFASRAFFGSGPGAAAGPGAGEARVA